MALAGARLSLEKETGEIHNWASPEEEEGLVMAAAKPAERRGMGLLRSGWRQQSSVLSHSSER